ncbi:response regulator [Paracoccus sp. (in: a-proteobacteria)]|uniref:response regulator n=1 Tax=Paracoccus sp. TaxID=267 RepID=UPI00396CC4D9
MKGDTLPHGSGRCLCILIVEDEPIIAMDLQFIFEDRGYAVLGPAGSVDMALRLLDQASPDVAVLDANLCGHSVAPVAERLRSLGIPFVVSSAYNAAQLQIHEVLANVENVHKPFQQNRLLAAVTRALGSE